MEFIAKGAEAVLYLVDGRLVKERAEKKYRVRELDERLRRLRTQREAKLLENAKNAGVTVPSIYKTDMRGYKIFMEYVKGASLKDVLEKASDEEALGIAGKIGLMIARMHDAGIVHNDLTTSNMLLSNGEVFFIDFGLGATSSRIEDKAMDLVVLKRSLSVAHTAKFKLIWSGILESYKGVKHLQEIISRVNVIEKRVRYSESITP